MIRHKITINSSYAIPNLPMYKKTFDLYYKTTYSIGTEFFMYTKLHC